MKVLLLLGFFFFSLTVSAQLLPGYNKSEARDMIAICNSYTFLDLYKTDSTIVPYNYSKIYSSKVVGMDNMFQVYQSGEKAIISIRGSTDKELSWMANVYTAMIPASGVIITQEDTFRYSFTKSKTAAVHSGYALALAYLYKDMLSQVYKLNSNGIYQFIITGHSQGGAIANLFRAYLENLPSSRLARRNQFKTYAFAAPMTGNKDFALEYYNRYAMQQTSFNIVNPLDEIPSLPLSYNDSSFVEGNLTTFLFRRDSFSLRKMLMDGGAILLEKRIGSIIDRFGGSASKKIGSDLGTVILPATVKDINYKALENKIEIPVFDYPLILKDSSILKNDSLMAINKIGSDGHFINKKLYKKSPFSFQHKPYNYYVSILKLYFPEEYSRLKIKILPENL